MQGNRYRTTEAVYTLPNNRLHLTAFGVGGHIVNPLQSSFFADVLPATHGGK
jgi:hypothetical protein